MTYQDFSETTRKMIDEFAAKRGLKREEVVKRFSRLFRGRGVSKHSRKIFA